MLRPNKHSDPALTILPVAGIILKYIRKQRIDELVSIHRFVVDSRYEYEAMFIPALYVLFLLGLIEYRKNTDTIEYVGL